MQSVSTTYSLNSNSFYELTLGILTSKDPLYVVRYLKIHVMHLTEKIHYAKTCDGHIFIQRIMQRHYQMPVRFNFLGKFKVKVFKNYSIFCETIRLQSEIIKNRLIFICRTSPFQTSHTSNKNMSKIDMSFLDLSFFSFNSHSIERKNQMS